MSLVEKMTVSLGNVHDGNHGEATLNDPREAYPGHHRGETFASAVRERGGTLLMMGLQVPKDPEERRRIKERMNAHNRYVHRIRAGIAYIFGTWKRSYGLRRMRWRGIAGPVLQAHLTAMTCTLTCTVNILAAD